MPTQHRVRPKQWSGLFCILLLSFTNLHPILANPVSGEIFNLRQPDGSTVEVRIWGDEFYQEVESLDGYTLVRDPKTLVICYARLSPDGNELLSTGVRAQKTYPGNLGLQLHIRTNRQAREAQIAAARDRFAAEDQFVQHTLGMSVQLGPPSSGNVKAICLIVDFPDSTGTIPPANVDNYCNQVGYTGYGNNGSIRDYFYDVSDGHLTYTNYVPPAYYRAIHLKSYYDNPSESCGPKARELILEALNDLESHGFDFSQYDSNGDGLVDGINCFYAGSCGSGWAKGLWPHSSSVGFSADGVSTSRYQITDMGSSLRLGTFCHENGHMVGYWPDLYDYDYDSRGAGRFCLMGYGGQGGNPVEPCAYMKYISGWTTTTLLDTPQSGLRVVARVNSIFKFPHPTQANEYYLIENRQRAGRDASYLPDSGIALWQIDAFGSNNNQQRTPASHYKVTLVQADGRWDLEHNIGYGDATDLWKATSYTACGPLTNPNTNWWSGDESGLIISQVSATGTTMTFTFETFPWVRSIVPADANPTSAPQVNFAVTFTKDVTGADINDFLLTAGGVSGTTVTGVSGSGTTYTVTVNTGAGEGTIRLDVADNDSIKDWLDDPLGGTGTGNGNFTSGTAYVIDRTATTVSMSSLAPDPTNTSPIAVTVAFSEAVRAFTTATITCTSASVSNLAGAGMNYSFDLVPLYPGLVKAEIVAGAARDVAGNGNTAAVQISRLFDNVAPAVLAPPSDGGTYTSSTLVPFDWTAATDVGAGVDSYDLQVGTTPGGQDVFDGNVGNVLTKAAAGANGQTLYARVRARDQAGNVGPWSGNSDGITVDMVRPRLTGGTVPNYTTVEITFNELVNNADLASNYSCTNGLSVLDVVRLNGVRYRLYTSDQRTGTSYTLTVGNSVNDYAGNPIDLSNCSWSFTGGTVTAVKPWLLYR